MIHCRSELCLSMAGLQKAIHYILMFTDDIILEVGFLVILNTTENYWQSFFLRQKQGEYLENGVLVNSDTYQMRYETFQTMRSFWRLPVLNCK